MEGVFIQRYTEKIQYISNEDPLNMQFSYEKNYICVLKCKINLIALLCEKLVFTLLKRIDVLSIL